MNTQELTASYRAHLSSIYEIRPAASTQEVVDRLRPVDRAGFDKQMDRIAIVGDADEDFYTWMSWRSRSGPVNSLKWMQILSSGVWATYVIGDLGIQGLVLDLGCQTGYWTSWTSTSGVADVAGIDQVERAIEVGRLIMEEHGLKGGVMSGDFTRSHPSHVYQCAVSLQGLTHYFKSGDYKIIENISEHVDDGGYVILVDELGDNEITLDKELTNAGLSVQGAGLIGGQGVDYTGWGFYLGLILRKDGKRSHANAQMAKELILEHVYDAFRGWANQEDKADWTCRNTAYFPYESMPVWQNLT